MIIPASSFLLTLVAFHLKGVQLSIDTMLVKLYSIDAVNQQLKSEITALSNQIFLGIIIIALISSVMATVSIYHKLCNKIIGTILVLISVLSVLFSLIRT